MITSRVVMDFEMSFRERMLCSIAAAVLGAGALSAGATAFGASKAADAQTAAANASIANQREMYGQNKELLLPFINAGQGGIQNLQDWISPTSGTNPLASLIKLTTPGADMSSVLEQTPGYKFSQNQGQKAVTNALAARGLGGSAGAVAKGVANFTQGLAGNTWDSVVKNLMSTFGLGTNALQGLVNTGMQGASSLAGVGQNTANSISGAITGAGNAQAAGWNAIGSAGGQLGNSLSSYAMLSQLTGGGGGGGSVYGSVPVGGYNMPTVGYNPYGY